MSRDRASKSELGTRRSEAALDMVRPDGTRREGRTQAKGEQDKGQRGQGSDRNTDGRSECRGQEQIGAQARDGRLFHGYLEHR